MVILISGASTGIGRACAVHMSRLGHDVWAGVRSQKSFDEIERLRVRGLRAVLLDVTSPESVSACVSRIRKDAGTLHGLVNNAGIAVGGPFEAVPLKRWRDVFETNLFGLVSLTQNCLPLLRESKGRVVNISSISGCIGFPFMGPYAASKFAVEAVSDSLRREMAPFGVKVAVVEPGAIATPIWEKSRGDGLADVAEYSPELKAVYGKMLEQFNLRLDDSIRKAAPVSVVVKAVAHALLSRTPRTRYPVGRGIQAAATVSRLLPDQWLDRLFR